MFGIQEQRSPDRVPLIALKIAGKLQPIARLMQHKTSSVLLRAGEEADSVALARNRPVGGSALLLTNQSTTHLTRRKKGEL